MRRLKQTVASLEKKGFEKRDGRDYNLIFWTAAGLKTEVRTRVPKGRGDLQPWEFRGIRKDLHLTEQQLLDLIDCPMSRPELEAILKTLKAI